MRNPWADLACLPPYVTADDEPYVTAWNNLPAVAGSLFSLDLDLPPEPFLGPHDAPLVVLSANPGRDPGDDAAYQRIGVAGRLAEVSKDGGNTFRWLADDIRDTPAGRWWRRCLGALHKEGYSSANCRNASSTSNSTDTIPFAGPRSQSPSPRNGSDSPLWSRPSTETP
jgi:hypothetical protein